MGADFTGCQRTIASGTPRSRQLACGALPTLGGSMDENDRGNDAEYEEDDEQIEQMIIENGILLHSLAALLVRKGVLTQEEIDSEMDRLYDQMENFEQQ
jgi:hypothetical protein